MWMGYPVLASSEANAKQWRRCQKFKPVLRVCELTFWIHCSPGPSEISAWTVSEITPFPVIRWYLLADSSFSVLFLAGTFWPEAVSNLASTTKVLQEGREVEIHGGNIFILFFSLVWKWPLSRICQPGTELSQVASSYVSASYKSTLHFCLFSDFGGNFGKAASSRIPTRAVYLLGLTLAETCCCVGSVCVISCPVWVSCPSF